MGLYLIVIRRTATGYSAHCPDVPGCGTVGDTIEQVRANMKRALEVYFERMVGDGITLPRPGGVDSYRRALKDLDVDHDLLAHVQLGTR